MKGLLGGEGQMATIKEVTTIFHMLNVAAAAKIAVSTTRMMEKRGVYDGSEEEINKL
jgi:hypothetical protein